LATHAAIQDIPSDAYFFPVQSA